MSDKSAHIEDLPPQKRILFELLRAEKQKSKQAARAIPRRQDSEPAVLSSAQQRLWFLDQLAPGNTAYHIALSIRIQGPLKRNALYESLAEIIRRHDSLRTTFTVLDGRPLQVIAPVLAVRLPIVDLQGLSESEREVAAQRLAIEASRRPFDLACGPLLRTSLLCLNPEEHLLLLTMHHIISDLWSIGVFLQELTTLYSAIAAGASPTLPDPPIQYADFAQWQQNWLQTPAADTHLSYWRQQLAGNIPMLELPTDRPRPLGASFQGARQPVALPKSLSDALKALSRANNVTLFVTLMAAFQLFLHRYTGQDDIGVGSPFADRSRSETAKLIGFFVNSLVLRSNFSGDPTFRELLQRVREVTLGAYAHQELPFERLVEKLAPERNLSHNPLFQIMFVLQDTPMLSSNIMEFSGLTIFPAEIENGTAKFDISLELYDQADGLKGWFDYNTDLFDAATMARMAEQLQALVEELVAHPDRHLSDFQLLTAAERQQMLVAWNATQAAYPADACLHELFEAQVERSPDAIALIYDQDYLTYQQLNRRANQLAHHLRSLGVGPESLVGLSAERSIELVVGLLGILKAGAAYVPLDPSYPDERIQYMLEDAQVAVLVTAGRGEGERGRGGDIGSFSSSPPLPLSPSVVDLRTDRPQIAEAPDTNPDVAVNPGNLAYVIYTSGSTGRPKGVMVPHQGVCNLLAHRQRFYHLSQRDRVLQSYSFSFDPSVWEFFWPLVIGAQLLMIRPSGHQDSAYLVQTIREQQITVYASVPSMLQVFLQEPGLEACTTLQHVFCGGEALSGELQSRFFARLTANLHNVYGPTEASIDATSWICTGAADQRVAPIGRPIANVQIYLLDQHGQPVPLGVPGELYIGGAGLARGYLNRPELTAERFVPNPFAQERLEIGDWRLSGAQSPISNLQSPISDRLYRTGDLARYLPDGTIVFLGRIDHQVKIRGIRIELEEIEAAVRRHPAVREVAVVAREDAPGQKRLVAYVVPGDGRLEIGDSSGDDLQSPISNLQRELRAFVRTQLPDYMVPVAFVLLDALPLSPNGKIDLHALPAPERFRPELETAYVAPQSDVERTIAEIWQEVLQVERAGLHDSFFELGGHSLLLVQLHQRLRTALDRDLKLVDLFQYPTISALAHFLNRGPQAPPTPLLPALLPAARPADIAIIAMAGRFPGAAAVEQFWRNLSAGVESLTHFSDQDLDAAEIPLSLRGHPHYVNARPVLPDIDRFDAPFFGMTPREAEMLDPQQRIFLECAWEALERAGYAPTSLSPVGVFAGLNFNSYVWQLATDAGLRAATDVFQLGMSSDKDFLATRVSYKLNLTGPSLTVQTACSTSLVAVHLACQSLRQGECTMALAGGVSISVPQTGGYLYQEGGITPPDGHCRAFDAQAQGTAFGSGIGVVVLKPLDAALADGDPIAAVIRGSAINNDGAQKVGYTAPSVDGQAEVIRAALAQAGLGADAISYVEAHGTGTPLGDPIEVAALTQAFRAGTDRTGYCGLGSVKTNIGHLDTAAGVAGLLKTVLALQHEQLPPSLHFQTPNPQLALESSPFYVVQQPTPWPRAATPRRAGVSSFGIGGTNAHVILEEAPQPLPTSAGRPWQLLLLSARSGEALEQATRNLAACLEETPAPDLADVAYTLQVGRRAFEQRRALVCRDRADALAALAEPGPRLLTGVATEGQRPVAFLLSGQGTQYVGMGQALYETEPVFREALDSCAALLKPYLDVDLREILYPGSYGESVVSGQLSVAADHATRNTQHATRNTQHQATDNGQRTTDNGQLTQTQYAQPALFAVEYALARLWMAWGVQPQALLGHSLGEYVAACLAGVFSLQDALKLVCARGRLMQALPAGAMLSVSLTEQETRPLLGEHLSLAAINGPALCTVSGPIEAIDALQQQLTAQGVGCRRLHTSHAFHSRMVEPILETFAEQVRQVERRPPGIPFVSNVSGTWITAAEATDPAYWATHLRQTVRFAAGVGALLREPGRILIEVGPGQALSAAARQHPNRVDGQLVLPSLPHAQEQAGQPPWLTTLGQLWLAGAAIDWRGFYAHERRRRVLLPTYPFERRRYWLAPEKQAAETMKPAVALGKKPDMADWFYQPSWKRRMLPKPLRQREPAEQHCWLVFGDAHGLGARLVQRLRDQHQQVVVVEAGAQFSRIGAENYCLDPGRPEDYAALLAELRARDWHPSRIIHLWSVTPDERALERRSRIREAGVPSGPRYANKDTNLRAPSRSFHERALERRSGIREAGVPSGPRYANKDTNLRAPSRSFADREKYLPGALAGLDLFEQAQTLGFYSLLFLAQALGNQALPAVVRLGVVSNQLHDITGAELLCPEKATILGACKVIPREYGQISCRGIDVVLPPAEERQTTELVEQILEELNAEASDTVIAYRDRHRWVQTFEPIRLEEQANEVMRLRERGVYLVTGGLGGIGSILAEDLARTVRARLVLVGRSALPDREAWEQWQATHGEQDAVSRNIQTIQTLEALGAEVLPLSADVTDLEQMRSVIAQGVGRFGAIHGIIHAAGLAGGGLIRFKTRADAEQVLGPKTRGLLALEAASKDLPLDFLMLFSSLSSIIGELGQADYCAANIFLDAFAHRNSARRGVPTLSVNWDSWQATGMAAQTALPAELRLLQEHRGDNGMSAAEGVAAFRRLLSQATPPQVIVSTGDLQARIDQVTALTQEHILDLLAQPARPHHPRPNVPTSYVAPRNDFERTIAAIWQHVLGFEQIGIHDDFFQLGGHSLLVTQLFNKLYSTYPVEIPLRSLFDHPTVAGIAGLVEQRYHEQAGGSARPIGEQIRAAAPADRPSLVEAYLKQKIATALAIEPEQLPANGDLAGLDLKTIGAELQWSLQQDLDLQVGLHEFRTIDSLGAFARFLAGELDRLAALRQNTTTADSLYAQYEPQVLQEPSIPRAWRKPAQKNPSMLFLHACPRSGSTLLRVMLAGHQALFAPPELSILWFDTMRELDNALSDARYGYRFEWASQGLQWAFSTLLGLDDGATRALVTDLTSQDVPIHAVYARLQGLAAPRLLVDKSPSYGMSLETLRRAEELFAGAKYIHLVRHPYAMIESFVRLRFDKLLGPVLYDSAQVDSHVVAEKVWVTENSNLLEFFKQVDPERHHLVHYEALVSQPEQTMRELCAFLDLPFDPAILHPYDNRPERMISGLGDPNILRHSQVEADLGQAWKQIRLPRRLGQPARRLAAHFGYELPQDHDLPDLDGAQAQGHQWGSEIDTIDQTTGEQLLANLDELSDEDVDTLLRRLQAEQDERP